MKKYIISNYLIDNPKILTDFGKSLFLRFSSEEVNKAFDITEDDFINYFLDVFSNTICDDCEIVNKTIYGQLGKSLNVKIEPAPDKWDRSYCIDFFIKVGEKYIGIQIKPVSSEQSINQYQWIEMNQKNHTKFEKKFGGKVFFVFSIKNSSGKKKIYNTEVIEQIREEINRLLK